MVDRRTTRASARRVGAFTVLEIIVAVGVLSLITVGVATIFSAVGETVTRGRKVSELNRYAAQIEQIMRRDFERMTRDGWLVVRNEFATDPGGVVDVPLFSGDGADPDGNGRAGRPRRIDELMFFARGSFRSQRRPLASGVVPRASQAQIYYGHGQGAIPDFASDSRYLRPRVGFDPRRDVELDELLGNQSNTLNPNAFASDWLLLRKVTLMSPLNKAEALTLPRTVFHLDRDDPFSREFVLGDNRRQVALQPAAPSVFRSLQSPLAFGNGAPGNTAAFWPDGLVSEGIRGETSFDRGDAPKLRVPRLVAGTVDIATIDLAEMRSIATSVELPPTDGQINTRRRFYQNWNPAFGQDRIGTGGFSGPGVVPGILDPKTVAPASAQRLWMLETMPSELFASGVSPGETVFTVARVRAEAEPPNLIAPDATLTDGDPRDELERAIQEADLEMLRSSIFIPRCTEFIVEWSYGWVFDDTLKNAGTQYFASPGDRNYKQLVWFGRERYIDQDQDGSQGPDEPFVALFYQPRGNPDPSEYDPTIGPSAGVILGRPDFVKRSDALPESAVFGFLDPGQDLEDVEDDLPWPWPTLIRVTMTIADPDDPSIETTTQFVFEVPGDGA